MSKSHVFNNFTKSEANLKSILLVIGSLCMIGCDRVYDISHTSTEFSPNPEPTCVIKAINSINGMSNVTLNNEEEYEYPHAHIYRYQYDYKGIQNSFFFSVQSSGITQFIHRFHYLNYKPTQDVVDKIHPALAAVENVLETQCGIINLRKNIKENKPSIIWYFTD